MATNFFRNFRAINYSFGDGEAPAAFQNISQYSDIIDQLVTSDVAFEDYTILSGERPDQVSFKLYGTTDYYWTLFLINEKLRTQGWPLTTEEVHTYAKKYYPHRVVTMKLKQADVIDFYETKVVDGEEVTLPVYRTKIIGTEPDGFEVGLKVTGATSGTFGNIVKRDLALGQLIVDTKEAYNERTFTTNIVVNSNGIASLDVPTTSDTFVRPTTWVITKDGVVVADSVYTVDIDRLSKKVTIRNIPFTVGAAYKLTYKVNRQNNGDGAFSAGEEISYPNPGGGSTSGVVFSETAQHLAVHHYEDADKNWIDIDPLTQTVPVGAKKITYVERLETINDDLKQIKYIKPDLIEQVVKNFHRLMNE
jgi:hypothetical protein